MLNELMGEIKK